MSHPKWFDFLAAVNAEIRQKSSDELVLLLKEVSVENDSREITWSSKDTADLKNGKKYSIADWLKGISENKTAISPFSFWSFIASYQEKEENFKTRLEKLKTILGISEKYEEFVEQDSIIFPQVTLEGWLQNAGDISKTQNDECWKLFNFLLDEKDLNGQNISVFANKICQQGSGIKDAAIKNVIRFIRPDISIDNKWEINNIPAYWNSAASIFLCKFANKKCKNYYQCEIKSDSSLRIHYEYICGGTPNMQKNDSDYKIYTEFHVEPRDKNADVSSLRNRLNKCGEITIREWARNGFAVRSGDGVSVLDDDGLARNKDEVNTELSAQMEALENKINDIVDKYISDSNYDWLLDERLELLQSAGQIILTGAPGTGKTFSAAEIANKLIVPNGGNMTENYCKVQFHPNFDYSDFIVGLKPKVVNGQVTFVWQDGIFKKFADKALYECKKNPASPVPYVFVIDEINRADLSRVFGEVFSLLEAEYRYPNKTSGITLPNGKNFILPENLYIIGTMNDIDRSVESMDFALRRRFSWVEVKASESMRIIDKKINDTEVRLKLKNVMTELNKYIGSENVPLDNIYLNLGDEYQLGGAYFVNIIKYSDEENPHLLLWENHIAVILNEYFRGRKDKTDIFAALYSKYKMAWEKE